MALVKYNSLEDFLGSLGQAPWPKFFLICGEDFLTRQAFDILSKFLLKDVSREFGLEVLEGNASSMGDIIEQVTTFSFLLSRKVIAVKNAPLFSAAGPSQEISYSITDMELLSNLIEKGIPDNNTLVMTCSSLDKRKKVFKTIQTHGTIIDCQVSQGVRKADLDEQRAVLLDIARKLLANSKKTMDAKAFSALVDLTGFNPELFARNLDKLTAYTGTNPLIGINDIKAVVIRDKKDPIFNLTNAILEKDIARALNFVSSLFQDGFHPLQILKSLENQVRKLLMVKSFIQSLAKNNDSHQFKRMNFNAFKQVMMPMIIFQDEKMKKTIADQELFLSPENTPEKTKGRNSGKKSGKSKQKTMSTDLVIAPNPNNPYPVFLIFQKSEDFSLKELKNAMIALGDLDYQLKSSAIEARVGIENFIINICRRVH
jgi:DNA polymerase III delta subunit